VFTATFAGFALAMDLAFVSCYFCSYNVCYYNYDGVRTFI